VILKILGAHEYSQPQLREPTLVIDAGANIGISSLYFAHRYPAAKVYAIEPEARNFDLLTLNCKDVRSIIPWRAAVWNRLVPLSLTDPAAESWAFSVVETFGPSGTIQSVTIPDILAHAKCDEIDLLKLDIEGAELELFSQDWDEWLPKVKTLVIELHDRFVPGCSTAFYKAITSRPFSQTVMGENVLISFG